MPERASSLRGRRRVARHNYAWWMIGRVGAGIRFDDGVHAIAQRIDGVNVDADRNGPGNAVAVDHQACHAAFLARRAVSIVDLPVPDEAAAWLLIHPDLGGVDADAGREIEFDAFWSRKV